jgi:hypothetical protein
MLKIVNYLLYVETLSLGSEDCGWVDGIPETNVMSSHFDFSLCQSELLEKVGNASTSKRWQLISVYYRVRYL